MGGVPVLVLAMTNAALVITILSEGKPADADSVAVVLDGSREDGRLSHGSKKKRAAIVVVRLDGQLTRRLIKRQGLLVSVNGSEGVRL